MVGGVVEPLMNGLRNSSSARGVHRGVRFFAKHARYLRGELKLIEVVRAIDELSGARVGTGSPEASFRREPITKKVPHLHRHRVALVVHQKIVRGLRSEIAEP